MPSDKAKTIIEFIRDIHTGQELTSEMRMELKARLDAVDRLERELFECRRALDRAIVAADGAGRDVSAGLKARIQAMILDLNIE